MKLEKLEQKYKELGEKIERIKSASKLWPQKGDVVYFAIHSGEICSDIYRNSNLDKLRLRNGDLSRTKAEVAAKRNYDRAYHRVTERIRELNDGWMPDWNDGSQVKWAHYLTKGQIKLVGVREAKDARNALYLSSDSNSRLLVLEMHGDLLIMLNG